MTYRCRRSVLSHLDQLASAAKLMVPGVLYTQRSGIRESRPARHRTGGAEPCATVVAFRYIFNIFLCIQQYINAKGGTGNGTLL